VSLVFEKDVTTLTVSIVHQEIEDRHGTKKLSILATKVEIMKGTM
jgi:hypothetical protein